MNQVSFVTADQPVVLIVDDTPASLDVVVNALTQQSLCVLVAGDGEEALERAEYSQPDLILLDVRMPGVDGFETCRRLKLSDQTRDIPVIFMTALTDIDDVIKGFSAGAVDYVTKPVQIAEMIARVGTHLALRSMHRKLLLKNRELSDEVTVRQRAEAALSHSRDELERRVEDRTAELAIANANLRSEIDGHRLTETKLQASEARFRAIVEAIPVPLVIASMPSGTILYGNPPFLQLVGVDLQRNQSACLADICVDSRQGELLLQHLCCSNDFHEREICVRNAQGSAFWAIMTARVATYDSAPALYIGLSDVTQLKRTEEALRESEARLTNAQRLARLGDWEWDSQRGMTHWSDEVYRILGMAPTKHRRSYRTFLSSVLRDDRAAVLRAIRALLGHKQPREVDCRVTGADGSVHIVHLQAEAITRGSDERLRLVGTIQDVTERKRIEHELVESRERLRKLSGYMESIREEERKRIAMEIHDELGQLLTALKMDVSLLIMRLPEDSDATNKAEDMRSLVEETLWMVRSVANHLRPAALDYGIASALEWLVEDFSKRTGVRCQLRIQGGEPVLPDPDATCIFRIVQASLTNVTRHANASHVEVTLAHCHTAVDLRISDDGCGFDPHAVHAIYSYGLLSMSERARMIGGSLLIESAPGNGTTVSIHIPFVNGHEK
jgi:PAS domain S-box-containing protein